MKNYISIGCNNDNALLFILRCIERTVGEVTYGFGLGEAIDECRGFLGNLDADLEAQ